MNDLKNELKIYTIREVEEILQVRRRTIYDYIKSGKLKAIKMGKYWRVYHNDLKEFMEAWRK